jgi:hypothetical protein
LRRNSDHIISATTQINGLNSIVVGYLPSLVPPPVRRRKDMVPERTYSFEIPPGPIPARDIKKDLSAEVVVVGAGIAGLSAALSSAEAGARTVLIEKTGTVQARGHDNAFIDSRLQKKLGIEIDKDEVILNLLKYSANKPDQRLIRMWAEGSGKTADWLMDMTDAAGLEVIICKYPPPPAFDNTTEYYPQYSVTHQYHSQRLVAKCLLDNALKKGVAVYFKTRAKQLLRRGKGRVTGLIAQNAAGEYWRFNAAKAVILRRNDGQILSSISLSPTDDTHLYRRRAYHGHVDWRGNGARTPRSHDPRSRRTPSQLCLSASKSPRRAVSKRGRANSKQCQCP